MTDGGASSLESERSLFAKLVFILARLLTCFLVLATASKGWCHIRQRTEVESWPGAGLMISMSGDLTSS
jgi:hypothetical protein